jgi:hypothetical protein
MFKWAGKGCVNRGFVAQINFGIFKNPILHVMTSSIFSFSKGAFSLNLKIQIERQYWVILKL